MMDIIIDRKIRDKPRAHFEIDALPIGLVEKIVLPDSVGQRIDEVLVIQR